MLKRLLYSLLSVVVVTAMVQAQCPTLTGPAISTNQACIGDVITLTMGGGTNLVPGAQTVDWYSGSTPGFDPLTQGTYVGSAQIVGSTTPCSDPPIVLGGLVNPCDGNNPSVGSEENEAMLIWSAGGFNGSDLGVEVNNSGGPSLQNIGTLGGCALLTTPTVSVAGGCVVYAGPASVVPPNAFVLVFTSSEADINFDFSGLCALGFPIYIFQSSCTRFNGTTNVFGAFTNNGSNSYMASFGCPGPFQSLTYTGSTGNNSSIAGWTLLGGNVPAPCNGTPFIPLPPTVPVSTVTIDPLNVTITAAECGQNYYSAVVAPPVAGCPQTGVGDLSLFVECLDLTISGNETVCVGDPTSAIQVSFTGGTPPYSFTYSIDAVSQGQVTTSDNPYTIPFTPTTPGTYTFDLVSSGGNLCPVSFSGSATVTATAGGPVNPLNTTACANDQPIDLTVLEDPAFPGGTWSGGFVTGTTFNAGSSASGPYTVTYTPPAGSSCSTPGDATITITAPMNIGLVSPPVLCGPTTYDLDLSFGGSPIAGVWSGPNLTLPSTFNAPAVGPGGQSFTFTFTPASGCFNPPMVTVMVTSGSTAMPLDATICVTDQPLDLTPLEDPAAPGGTWSGLNVSGSSFDAGPSASGNYTITYTPPIGGGGCILPGTSTITVTPATTPTLASATACVSNAPIDLATLVVGGFPAGTWAGTGVSGGFFNPGSVPLGTYTLTFTPTPGLCYRSETTSITIIPAVFANLGTATLCVSDPSFALIGIEDSSWPGGTWSGPGVSGGFFNPAAVGVGTHTITYTPPPGQCAIATNTGITVTSQTAPTLGTATVCVSDPLFDLTTLQDPSFPTGTWSGTGVSGTNFNPSSAGVGSASVTFTPSGGSTCEGPSSTPITVTNAATPLLGTLTTCQTAPTVDLTTLVDPSYPNGTWSGPGVIGSNFFPSTAGAGTHTLTFTPDATSCAFPSTTPITIVAAGPAQPFDATICASDQPLDLTTLDDPVAPFGTWSGANVSGTTFDAGPSASGSYTVTYTPPVGGCTTPGTATITISASGTPTLGTATICLTGGLFDLFTIQDPAFSTGTWSGAGTSGSFFNPTLVGVGTHNVTFTPTGGCLSPATTPITVSNAATPVLSTATLCVSDAPLDLTTLEDPAYPGGVWSGPSVSSGFFNPTTAGAGSYTLTYTVSGGCVNQETTTVTVNPAGPSSPLDATICAADQPLNLTTLEDPAAPGGTWSGANVAGSAFNAGPSASGSYTVTYTPTAGGCTAPGTATITISASGTPTLGTATICLTGGLFDLFTIQDPSYSTGTWSGAGVSGSFFNPTFVGVGTHNVTFTPTGGCLSPATTPITVSNASTPALSPATLCVADAPLDLTTLEDTAYPGGVWTGTSVSAGFFNPTTAGAGSYTLTYTVSSGCVNPVTTTVTVTPAGPAQPLNATICASDQPLDLTTLDDPSATGGAWSGANVTGTTFNAGSTASGSYTVTYTPPAGGCAAPGTATITISAGGTPTLGTSTVCITSGLLDLITIQDPAYSTGAWSGSGVSGSFFDPTVVGVGTHNVTFTPSGGCLSPETTAITVNTAATPSVSNATLCITDSPLILSTLEDPAYTGGVWTGPSVSAGSFDPSIGVGSYSLTYTDGGTCVSPATSTITVTQSGTPVLTPATLCASDAPLNLSTLADPAYPTGTWSGVGVVGSTLDPSIGSTGMRTLTFTPSGGCASPATVMVTVSASGTPVLATATVCETEIVDLTTLQDPSFPAGSWSGSNVSGTTFTAAGLPPADYTLTFTPTAACALPNSTPVTVYLADPTSGRDTIICAGSAAFGLDMLLNGAPVSGTWSGPGVAAGQFDAPNVASGTYGLTFTPATGVCALPTMIQVTVQVSGTPTIANQTVCTTSPIINLDGLVPSPYTGGVWSGTNVSTNRFDPSAVAPGNYRLIYSPGGACTNPVTITITVSSSITLSLPLLAYCIDAGIVDLTAQDPTAAPGGTWSGPGVSANQLDPTGPGPGNYTLTYTPPAGGCATSAATTQLEISPLTTVGIFTDTVCAGSGPVDLSAQLDPSFATGSWSGSSVTSAGIYTPSSTTGPDQVTFTPNGGCYSATQFNFNVVGVSTLIAGQPTFTCAPDGLTYLATLSVTTTPNNGTITTSLGTLIGSVLTITGLVSGSTNSVTIDDAATCNAPITVDISFTCPSVNCTTEAGTLSGGPFQLCSMAQLVASGAIGSINDGDDLLFYYLDDDTNPDNGFIAQSLTPEFSEPTGYAGQSLVMYALAGNDDGAGGISSVDNCRSQSNALQVTWAAPIVVVASTPICNTTQDAFTVDITLSGGWSPYTEVAGNAGTFTSPSVFSAGPYPTGSTVNLSFNDAQNCGPVPFTVTHDCSNPCVAPNPGTFDNSPLLLCDIFLTDGNYNNDASLGAGDVQVFIVYGDAAGTAELGRYTSLPIDFATLGLTNGIVYISSLAGEDDGSGGISTTCFAESPLRLVQLGQTQQVTFDTTVCSGTTLLIEGTTYTQTSNTGSYTVTGFGASCDTIVNVTVNFSTAGGTTIDRTDVICNNETLLIGGRTFSASNPSDTFTVGATACDTTYRVALMVLPPADSLLRDTLCFGDSLVIGNLVFNQTMPTGTSVLRARNGCDSLVTVEVEFLSPPVVSIVGPPSYCAGEDIQVTVRVEGTRPVMGNVFLNGNPTGSTTLPVGDNTLSFPATSGFSFRLSNIVATTGGCAQARPQQVSYSPQVSQLNAEIPTPLSGEFTACGDNTVASISVQTGNGIGPYRFAWSTGDTTNTISNVAQGSYAVTITDNLGCISMTNVVVGEGDTIAYTLSTIDPICPDGEGSISISLDELPPNAQFRFDLPGLDTVTSLDFSFDSLASGTYVFQLIQDNGCDQSTLITIDDPVFYDIIRFDTIDIQLGDSARIFLDLPNSLDSIRWLPGEYIDCDTCERVLVSPPFDLEYEAIAYTTEGCEVGDLVYIRVAPITEIYMPTAFSPNGDRVNDVLLPYGGPEVERVESFMVFDRWGNLLHKTGGFMPGDVLYGWDGTHRGKLMNSAIFVAMAEVRFKNGTVQTFTGDVLLVR